MSADNIYQGTSANQAIGSLAESQEEPLNYWITMYPEIWQYGLLNPEKLSNFVKKLGLSSFTLAQSRIKGLWELGLLRADLIVTSRKLSTTGLIYARTMDDGRYIYIDGRSLRRRRKGWGGALGLCKEVPKWIELYFHPFRYYVLYKLQNAVDLNINLLQFLLSAERYPSLSEKIISGINKYSKTLDFTQKVGEWNDVASFAIMVEPCVYSKIFHKVQYSYPNYTIEAHESAVAEHRKNVRSYICKFDIEKLEAMREELCRVAQIIEPNQQLHVLLRLTNAEMRLRLEGAIGGSMLVLTMGEMIRRITEDEFKVCLPEEDQLGFGVWMYGARKRLYGTNRILDAPQVVKKKFIGSLGLNTAPRFRCYVEGDTEYGALDSVFTPESSIELINLSGNFIEGKKKGLAFRDSLRNDKNSHIMSIVILDGDQRNVIRVLKKAVEQDEMFGLFYISEPDFELANFTIDELGEILWKIAEAAGSKTDQKDGLIKSIQGATSGEEIKNKAKQAIQELNQFAKGFEWGKALIDYAWKNPNFNPDESGETRKRPIIEIIELLWRGLSVSFSETPDEYRVDINTGKLVKREAAQ